MSVESPPKYLNILCEYLCNTKIEDLPADLLDRGRWIIADSLAVIAAGMQVDEMRPLIKQLLASESQGEASVIGTHLHTNPMSAALLNGTAGTWLELDEGNIYAKGHPGIQVVPAAFAKSEQERLPGSDLLLSVILGYEASARISRACKMRLAIHPHGTYGTIGAAVAIAKLMRYGLSDMQNIINISSTMGIAASRRTLIEGATVRNIYAGMSGYMGIMAYQLVQAGFTGEVDGVRSVYGSIYADEFDPELVIEDLGKDFLMERNYFKLHSCGRYIHSVLDLVEIIAAQRPNRRIIPEEVEGIEIEAYHMASALSHKSVSSSFGAKFSVPFAVATLIFHGRPQVSNFDERAVSNTTVQKLAQHVDIKENPDYTAQYPNKQLCQMRIRFKNGSVAEAKSEITKGEVENPHTLEEMKDKFFLLTKDIWGERNTEKIYKGLMRLEEIEDVNAFSKTNRI